jgi:AcrR family transcriptional regulator
MTPVTPRKSKTGRTQQERSAAMRRRLLDATIDCLVAYGYAGTTTTKVTELAGVTRGAQVHHFPTRADLVAAAVRHLAAKRTELAFDKIDSVRRAPDPLDAALDLMWRSIRDRSSTPRSRCGWPPAPTRTCASS